MRKNLLLSVLSLFLLVPASITWAQTAYVTGTVSGENDYRTIQFNSPPGRLTVILPGDLSAAGTGTVTISGTVIATPAGETKNEKDRNEALLRNQVLRLAGTVIPFREGRNAFRLSLPAGSTRAQELVCTGPPGGKDATVVLRNPVLPPAPATGNLAADQPPVFTDQQVFLTNGNIPVYAANNTRTLFQPSDQFFIQDGTGNKTAAVVLAQSPTQTVLALPAGVQPGAITITRQSGNHTDQVKTRLAALSLSSSGTNLRKGQTAALTVTIDPKITELDSAEAMQIPVMSLDLKNLTPGIIELSGGNIQVLRFPAGSGRSATDWTANRTITGVRPGEFNISATLYPSIDLAGPLQAQKKALTTCEEFNRWAEGIKKDLEHYVQGLGNEHPDYKDIAQKAIDNIPNCNGADELEDSKWTVDYLLRFLPGFRPGTGSGQAALAAYETAAAHVNDPSLQENVHTDVIRNGLVMMQNGTGTEISKNAQDKISNGIAACDELDKNYTPAGLRKLRDALAGIASDAALSSLLKKLKSGNAGETHIAGGEKTRVGAFDPLMNTLWVLPEEQERVLSHFGASKQNNGQYLIHCSNRMNAPLTLLITVKPATLKLLNKRGGDKAPKPKDKAKEEDGYDYVLELDIPAIDWDQYRNSEAYRARQRYLDSLRRYGKAEFSTWFRDSAGTVYNFYRNAQCVKVMNAHTEIACAPNQNVENLSDSLRYFEEFDKNFGKNPQHNRAGQFMKVELYDRWNCLGGDDFCISKFVIVGLKYVYADKDCKKLIEVVKIEGLDCQ